MSSGPNYPQPRKQVSASAGWLCKIGTAKLLAVAVVAANVSTPMRTMGLVVGMAVVMVLNPALGVMSTRLSLPLLLPFLTALM